MLWVIFENFDCVNHGVEGNLFEDKSLYVMSFPNKWKLHNSVGWFRHVSYSYLRGRLPTLYHV